MFQVPPLAVLVWATWLAYRLPADRSPAVSATNLRNMALLVSSVTYTVRLSGITYLGGWGGGG